jgi:hypothetical protein
MCQVEAYMCVCHTYVCKHKLLSVQASVAKSVGIRCRVVEHPLLQKLIEKKAFVA